MKMKKALIFDAGPIINFAMNGILPLFEDLQKEFKTIVLMLGNHEYRIKLFREGPCPRKYVQDFSIKDALNLKKRGIKLIKYNDWIDIASLSVTHGMYAGQTALKRHYEACGRSVVYGHLHSHDEKSFIRRGKTIKAIGMPCMCSLNPDYLKNRENNWANGFGEFHFKSNGHFHHNIIHVWDDEAILPGGVIIKG